MDCSQFSYQDTFKRINKIAHSMKSICKASHIPQTRLLNTDTTPTPLFLREPTIPSFLTSPECSPAIASAITDTFVRSAQQIRLMYQTKYRLMAFSLASDPTSSGLECPNSFFEHRYQEQLLVLEQLAVTRARQLQQTMHPRTKPTFNQESVPLLEAYFEHNAYPSAPDRVALARKSMMTPRQIEVWFQNHRNRAKKEGKILRRLTSDSLPLKLSLDLLQQKMPFVVIPEHQRNDPFSEGSSEQDLSEDSGEDVQPRGITDRDVCPAFCCKPPVHAYPAIYPASCEHDPFLRTARKHTFAPLVWRRKPATSLSLSPSIDFEDFISDFASKLIIREGSVKRHNNSHSLNKPRKPWFSATHTTVPPAPHPALIPSLPAVHLSSRCPNPLPSVSAPSSRLHPFRSPSPCSLSTHLLPVQSRGSAPRKVARLPRRIPDDRVMPHRGVSPATSEASLSPPSRSCSSSHLSPFNSNSPTERRPSSSSSSSSSSSTLTTPELSPAMLPEHAAQSPVSAAGIDFQDLDGLFGDPLNPSSSDEGLQLHFPEHGFPFTEKQPSRFGFEVSSLDRAGECL